MGDGKRGRKGDRVSSLHWPARRKSVRPIPVVAETARAKKKPKRDEQAHNNTPVYLGNACLSRVYGGCNAFVIFLCVGQFFSASREEKNESRRRQRAPPGRRRLPAQCAGDSPTRASESPTAAAARWPPNWQRTQARSSFFDSAASAGCPAAGSESVSVLACARPADT